MQFVVNNWSLFVTLGVILALLIMGPVTQQLYGVKNSNVNQAVQLLNREHGVVIDVSEPGEFKTGHITNAINVPFSALMNRIRELEKHKNNPIIVTCRTGNRSTKSAVALRKHGFPSVYVLSGGLNAWEKENMPLERS